MFSIHVTQSDGNDTVLLKLEPHHTMNGTPLEELKSLSHSDKQLFVNYLGSRLRTSAKVYHTGHFASLEEQKKVQTNWASELVSHYQSFIIHWLLGLLQHVQ